MKKLVWLFSLFMLAPAGCTHTDKTSCPLPPPAKDAAPTKLITTGSCMELKDPPADKGLTAEFELRVGELLSQHKLFSAAQLVERYPDRANAFVGSSVSLTATGVFIKQTHQRQLAGADVYTAVANLLAQGEKHRLNKHESAWIASWEKAVQIAAAGPVPDPNLWEKISSLQPANQPWPESLAGTLQSYWARRKQDHVAATPCTTPDLVWFSIGHWHLDRGEVKAAQAAFMRADNLESGPWKDMIVLYKARVMTQLKQSPAAITLLAGLATHNDSPWKRSALAAMGACKFQDGHFKQAEALFRKALDDLPGDEADFPGKSEAQSNLGLTLLALGQEAAGLKLLHAGRDSFAGKGCVDDVLQDLSNEIRYFEARNCKDLVIQLRQEYDSWQRRVG